MKESKNLNDLIEALTILPGIGRKSAQRMAYKLIRSNKEKLTFEEAVMRDMKTFSDLVNSDSKINDDYFKNQIKNNWIDVRAF